MAEEELFRREDVIDLALRLLEFHKKLNQLPIKWRFGRLEKAQLFERLLYFGHRPESINCRDFLFDVQIEWVDEPSVMDLVVVDRHQPHLADP